MTANTLMIMGTSSSAGKSLLTAALCRCFARRGLRVAPFKAQNMSNNASVCSNGGEIGRSQALQALAAGVDPHTDMNPILLKPEGDAHSQVIVDGRPWQSLDAKNYFARKQQLWPVVTGAIERLRRDYELIIIEGAGSPAELNLTEVEIVNMSVARHCRSTVLLVGDIERGGIFAQLLGTLWLLPSPDRMLIRGLIVNKFRGDLQLFDRGREILQQRSDIPVLGVLPWIDALNLPEEDAVALSPSDSLVRVNRRGDADLQIAIIRLPHIANFDDFDSLANVSGVQVDYVSSLERLGRPDVIVLPGSKNTLGDLHWLRATGLADHIITLARRGVSVVGICGGYQMLGTRLHNPGRLEGSGESAEGLGLLDIETVFKPEKQTCQVRAEVSCDIMAPGCAGQFLTGYEIHVGQSTSKTPWLKRTFNTDNYVTRTSLDDAIDGAHSQDGRIWGCYLHGLFHNPAFRNPWLRSLGVEVAANSSISFAEKDWQASIQDCLDRLADVVEKNIDLCRLKQLIWNMERTNA